MFYKYYPAEEGEDVAETVEKIEPRSTVYMLDNRDTIIINGCPTCGKEATVRHVGRFGYTCACDTLGCPMSGNRASYLSTAFDAINNWNCLTLAIKISHTKGGKDESILSRIFGTIPWDSKVPDESGHEPE